MFCALVWSARLTDCAILQCVCNSAIYVQVTNPLNTNHVSIIAVIVCWMFCALVWSIRLTDCAILQCVCNSAIYVQVTNPLNTNHTHIIAVSLLTFFFFFFFTTVIYNFRKVRVRKEVAAQISTWPSRWSFLLDEYEKVKYSRIVWRLSLYQLLQLQTTDLCLSLIHISEPTRRA